MDCANPIRQPYRIQVAPIPERYSRGWHCIGLASDYTSQPVAIDGFGTRVVAFRGERGQVVVLDAHCPHMGADLSFGRVEGCSLRCPFHGWRWGADGVCDDIPYARRIPPKAVIRSWPTLEENRLLFIWNDPEGNPPAPEHTPPRIDDCFSGEWSDWTMEKLRIPSNARELIDNMADVAHFGPIHRARVKSYRNIVQGVTFTQQMSSTSDSLAETGELYSDSTYVGLQRVIQRNLIRSVVDLHSLDMAELGLDEFASLNTVEAALRQDLDTLQAMYQCDGNGREPELDFALYWLRCHIPDRTARAVLVHGDVGPGNFLFDDKGKIAALIDWEVAHMGHPLEDLAAVLCRSLGVEFGTCADHISDYECFTGNRVERTWLDYFVVLVLTRWYIGLNLALSRPSSSQNIPILVTYRQSVAHTLVKTLAKCQGFNMPPWSPVSSWSSSAYLYVYIMDTLGGFLGRCAEDSFMTDRLKGVIRLVRYLRDLDGYGAERLLREELSEIAELVGPVPDDLAAARQILCRQVVELAEEDTGRLVRHLVTMSCRRHGILASAMGAMAERTLDY